MKAKATWRMVLPLLLLAAAAGPARAQQILLEPVKAGPLTLFRDLTDEKVYYYVSDQPRIATGADGRPEFSLMRWVENTRGGPGEPAAREGDGGGILHALVTLGITPEQIQEAQAQLQRQRPGGVIRGPVLYRRGTFTVSSSFKDPQGGYVTQVVGLGNAPLLDGEKAAVSFQLTKLGAKVLWESLQMPTSDISFSFDMDVEGFNPPARAVLEADFDQIYSHKAFAAGVATTHLGVEIEAAFDDLRRSGGIKLTEIGDNADLHTLISTAYAQVAKVMFENAPEILKPAGGIGGAGGLGGLSVNDSMLSRATALLAAGRSDGGKSPDPAKKDDAALVKARADAKIADDAARAAEAEADRLEREVQALSAAAPTSPAVPPTPPKPVSGTATPTAAPTPTLARPDPALAAKKEAAAKARQTATARRAEARKAQALVAQLEAAGGSGPTPDAAKKDERPTWAAVASFQMKEFHQSGKLKWDLNKYTASTLSLHFSGNVGDVRQFKDHFREINLASPLYQQREVTVYVDGANVADFAQYVNFVTVRLHKRHAGGAITDDEVLIDRNNFNKEGNRFTLLYGWKGDNERSHWMEYEYQTVWSLFGGKTVETPLQRSTAQAIPVTAPYVHHTVELRGDAAELARADVRAVNVKVYYSLGGTPQMKQASLDVARPQTTQIEFMSLPDAGAYEYEITWRLKGNRTLTSGRQPGGDNWIDVGDLPAS